jgi:hypothetical protein
VFPGAGRIFHSRNIPAADGPRTTFRGPFRALAYSSDGRKRYDRRSVSWTLFAMPNRDETGSPGKTRTWWHPLLVGLLKHELSPVFEVRDEVRVGTLPLQADIVLVRRGAAAIPDSARRSFGALAERLNRWTLIEFKSPVDSLERGDLGRLFGVAHLFIAQQAEEISASDVSLVILAPSSTKPFEAEVQQLGLRWTRDEPGVLRIEGHVFTTWLLESDEFTSLEEPGLTVFSRGFLSDRQLIMEMVRNPDTQPVLRYVFQQIRQFQQSGDAFMIQHTHTAAMDQEHAAFMEALLQSLTPEDLAALSSDTREALLHLLTPEDLAALSTDTRKALLQSVTPEDLLDALAPDDRLRLFERLCAEGFVPPGNQPGQ